MKYDNLVKLASYFEKFAQEYCFFVDLDETIVHSEAVPYSEAKDIKENENIKLISTSPKGMYSDAGSYFISMKRPYADEFLTELNNLGRVTLVTASNPIYAETVIKKHNLDQYFDKFYAGNSLNGVARENCNKFILIDDHFINSDNISKKMTLLGLDIDEEKFKRDYINFYGEEPSKEEIDKFLIGADQKIADHLITVKRFEGNLNDTELPIILNKIKANLSRL